MKFPIVPTDLKLYSSPEFLNEKIENQLDNNVTKICDLFAAVVTSGITEKKVMLTFVVDYSQLTTKEDYNNRLVEKLKAKFVNFTISSSNSWVTISWS